MSDMKIMVLGLPPTYEYTGDSADRTKDADLYAANAGGSLISNALCQLFNGEFVYHPSNIEELNSKYDACVLSLATHLDPNRDVSKIANIVEKLDMPVVIFAVGITAYEEAVAKSMKLHPSFRRLLDLVSERSSWIGVRGHYSASVLQRHGYTNVVPIGCPTMYREMNPNLQVKPIEEIKNPLLVYHFTAKKYIDQFSGHDVLGQDFHDHFVFTVELNHDEALQKKVIRLYGGKEKYERSITSLKQNNMLFYADFQKWYDTILEHDFVFGPRLHGCLAAIGVGRPAVLTDHDLRIREIAEFYDLPMISEEQLGKGLDKELLRSMDFSGFNKIYPLRYKNFLHFIRENKLVPAVGFEALNDDNASSAYPDFEFTYKDMATINSITQNIAISGHELLFNTLKKLENKNGLTRMTFKLLRKAVR